MVHGFPQVQVRAHQRLERNLQCMSMFRAIRAFLRIRGLLFPSCVSGLDSLKVLPRCPALFTLLTKLERSGPEYAMDESMPYLALARAGPG